MAQELRVFHRLFHANGDELLLYSPVPGCFVWISLYLPPRRRGSGNADTLVEAAMRRLPGHHEVHFDRRISTFAEIARCRRWRCIGPSRWIGGCHAYSLLNVSHSRSLPPGYRYELTVRPMVNRSYRSGSDLYILLERIDEWAKRRVQRATRVPRHGLI